MKTREEITNIARHGIQYMTRSEANKIFYEIVDVDKMVEKYGDKEGEPYIKKKKIILLKIRKKSCKYDIKNHPENRNVFDNHIKFWLKKHY